MAGWVVRTTACELRAIVARGAVIATQNGSAMVAADRVAGSGDLTLHADL